MCFHFCFNFFPITVLVLVFNLSFTLHYKAHLLLNSIPGQQRFWFWIRSWPKLTWDSKLALQCPAWRPQKLRRGRSRNIQSHGRSDCKCPCQHSAECETPLPFGTEQNHRDKVKMRALKTVQENCPILSQTPLKGTPKKDVRQPEKVEDVKISLLEAFCGCSDNIQAAKLFFASNLTARGAAPVSFVLTP